MGRVDGLSSFGFKWSMWWVLRRRMVLPTVVAVMHGFLRETGQQPGQGCAGRAFPSLPSRQSPARCGAARLKWKIVAALAVGVVVLHVAWPCMSHSPALSALGGGQDEALHHRIRAGSCIYKLLITVDGSSQLRSERSKVSQADASLCVGQGCQSCMLLV